VLWGLIGFVAAVLLALAVPALAGKPVSAVALVGGAVLGVGGGVLGRDWWLGRQVARRQARMLRELPTLADLLCLAVTAGDGPRAALERAVTRSRGELSRELAVVLADLRAGEPFVTAMERLAVRAPMPPVVRFVDGLVVAVERGTPLGDVLRAQAADVREQHKRDLIEAGGRREVLMLVPVSIGLDTCRGLGQTLVRRQFSLLVWDSQPNMLTARLMRKRPRSEGAMDLGGVTRLQQEEQAD
jgi:tight adherence protein C